MKIDYDDVSPITGNKCVIIESDEKTNEESRLCMESGYTTKDTWKTGSDMVKNYEEHVTELMCNLKFEDDLTSLTWYPSTMVTPIVMLYPKGANIAEWCWEVAEVTPITGEERLKYPVPGIEGQYYTNRVDIENAKQFSQGEFESALDTFYGVIMKSSKEPEAINE
jgi:hypothetical protein